MSEALNVTLVTFLGYIDGCWLYKGCYACPLKRYFFHAPNTLSFLKQTHPQYNTSYVLNHLEWQLKEIQTCEKLLSFKLKGCVYINMQMFYLTSLK